MLRHPLRLVRRLVAALALALAAAPAAVAGPSGFAFLEVPAGARASALGGAYTSIAEGVDAAFWNPAGLARLDGIQITGSHYEFFQHLRHDQFAVATKLFGGGVAAGLRALYSESIVERDDLGNEIGTFGGHDLEFSLAYGAPVGAGLRAGGSAQVVRERIARSAATTYALSGGVTWEPAGSSALRFSVSAHNLGPAAHYMFDGVAGQDVPLPTAVHAGVSYGRAVGTGLAARGAFETRVTRGRTAIGMIGAEIGQPLGAVVRAGFRAHDEAQSFSVGAGYALPGLQLDYAFVPYRLELGDTHRMSFSARF